MLTTKVIPWKLKTDRRRLRRLRGDQHQEIPGIKLRKFGTLIQQSELRDIPEAVRYGVLKGLLRFNGLPSARRFLNENNNYQRDYSRFLSIEPPPINFGQLFTASLIEFFYRWCEDHPEELDERFMRELRRRRETL